MTAYNCLVLVGGLCAGQMHDVPVGLKTFRVERVEPLCSEDIVLGADIVPEAQPIVWDDYALVEIRTGNNTWNMIRFARHVSLSDAGALSELLKSYLSEPNGGTAFPLPRPALPA